MTLAFPLEESRAAKGPDVPVLVDLGEVSPEVQAGAAQFFPNSKAAPSRSAGLGV